MQQVEWYMGRLNLEKDEYLKEQMDDDLWVSLDIILNFPKMQRLGVQDKRRVATLLHARSTVVEVDEKAARIRPAWARRSTIVIHNVPATARLEQITGLLQIPSNADLTNAHVPPTVTHPQGLISIQPAGDTIWLAIFDSPTGASESVHLLVDKEINGQKVNPEVLVENSLRPSSAYRQPDAHAPMYNNARPVDQQNSAAYAQAIPVMSAGMMTNQMMNPMGMPIPVIHHPSQEAHPQYTYAPPPASYAPGYAQNMPMPRQFMGPRGIPTGYVMTYPPTDHAYDPAHAVLPAHQIRPQQQQVDENGAPIMTQPAIPVEGATAGQVASAVPAVPNGVQPPASGDAPDTETADFVSPDHSITQAQADAQRIAAQIPYATPVTIPVISGQPIEGQMMPVKPVDMHYMHRTQMMGDPNMYPRGNGRQQGTGRDRGQRNADGSMRASRGSLPDGQRSGMHRKGKKGNRGGGRHGHSHDRDRRDAKGDGSSSDSGNRDDRSLKNKPEPNLASMHFPPLPMSENAGTRVLPKVVLKKEETAEKAPVPPPVKETKEVISHATVETPAPAEPKPESAVGSESENVVTTTTPEAETITEKESTPKETSAAQAPKTEAEVNEEDVVKVAEVSAGSKDVAPVADEAKKPEPKAPVVSAPSPMSYAAILRSKKPGPPPRPVQPAVSRSSSGASGKNADNSSGSEANSSGSSHPPKEKGGRRRKSNNSRNNHVGDTKDANSASNGSKNEKHVEKKGSDAAPAVVAESKESNNGGGESSRSKPVVENTRAHSVWANKPKSLFQAASAAPTARVANPQSTIDAKKISSPVSSQGDEKEAGSERASKEANTRTAPNSKTNGAVSPRTSKDENKDGETNGSVDAKDAGEKPTVEKPAQKPANSSKVDGESSKTTSWSKGAEKPANVSVKGAWAAGGPKAWPKNGANGVMEKMSNTTES